MCVCVHVMHGCRGVRRVGTIVCALELAIGVPVGVGVGFMVGGSEAVDVSFG